MRGTVAMVARSGFDGLAVDVDCLDQRGRVLSAFEQNAQCKAEIIQVPGAVSVVTSGGLHGLAADLHCVGQRTRILSALE